jgi:glycosidase
MEEKTSEFNPQPKEKLLRRPGLIYVDHGYWIDPNFKSRKHDGSFAEFFAWMEELHKDIKLPPHIKRIDEE